MSKPYYDQTDDSGAWVLFKEYVYPSREFMMVREHHATELDDRGKPKKRFKSWHFEQNGNAIGTCHGTWVAGDPPELELFVIPDRQNVIFVEGEACAEFVNENLREVDLDDWVATAAPGGCQRWTGEYRYLNQLKGKHVYGAPDWEQAGYDYIAKVMASARERGAVLLKVVELDGQEKRGDDVKDWLLRGKTIEDFIKRCQLATAWTPGWEPMLWKRSKAIPIWRHGDELPVAPRMLIRNRLPEIGVALLAGQWGTGKTFAWLDASGSIMTGADWLGEPVCRRGGVLAFTPEGGTSVAMRLAALIEHKLSAIDSIDKVLLQRLPFGRALDCPVLLKDNDALQKMIATALETEERFKRDFGLPLAAIVIDTVIEAAGWENEQDNAEVAKVWRIARKLSEATGALVLLVDHFGKVEDRGTRGASAKETNSDAILALLGDRTPEGAIENARLSLRKFRDGPDQGRTFPYELQLVEMGFDEKGRQVTQRIVKWVNGNLERPKKMRQCVRLMKQAIERAGGLPVDTEALREAHQKLYRELRKSPGAERQAWMRAYEEMRLCSVADAEMQSGERIDEAF